MTPPDGFGRPRPLLRFGKTSNISNIKDRYMKYQNLAAIAAATGALAIGSAADTPTEWWNADFESAAEGEFELSLAVDGGTFTKENENDKSAVYAFSSEDAEKYGETEGKALNLNTEGSTLTFQPSAPSSSATQTVVDADVWFVGAESDPGSFDSAGDVQVAVYLKVTDDESVAPELMAYTYEDGESIFKSLPNAAAFEFADKSWYHIQILVDRTTRNATYKVGAKGCADAELVDLGTLRLANSDGSVNPVSEVGFRGTGMVDNFVGKQIEVSTLDLEYLVKAYDADGVEIEDFLTLDPTSDSTITAVIEGFDSTEAPLVRVKVYAADGSVVGNYATVVDAGTVEIEELGLGPDFELSLDIDVSSFVEAEEGGLVLELFYGTDPDAVEPGDFPTQEEFAAAMADAGLAIDPDAEEGFVVTFDAPYAGQYKLQYSATPNGPFADEAGEGAAATAEAQGDSVKLVGDATQDARFFRVKLYE